ncbi:MAG: FAD-binding oxidoreductase [Pseudomonadota bacterium]
MSDETADVVIIGGAAMGSTVAWFLSSRSDFQGRIVVIEPDPTYEHASTALSASCIRHQFSNDINVRMSMFGTTFVQNFRTALGNHPDVPEIALKEIGYLFLAPAETAHILKENYAVQSACSAATELLSPDDISARFPFYNLDGIACGSFNQNGEGWFDGYGMMQALKAAARRNGVSYRTDKVISFQHDRRRIASVGLASGAAIRAEWFVNAAGRHAADIAKAAGVHVPVEPRKRCLFVFSCATELGQPMPLTIDPSGVHCRSDGKWFLAGTVPKDDRAVAYSDFDVVYEEFEDMIWPALAHRVPAFEAIRLERAWAGHYAYNTLDQNAIIGPHPDLENLVFANGFSGHGLQQSPAVGRGISEWIANGRYETLDLSPLGYDRVLSDAPFLEKAII